MAREKKLDAVLWAGLGLVAAVVLALPTAAGASSGGGEMPWEGPLTRIVNSLKGPVAFSISLLGILVTGVALIWGGEIGEFVRKLVMLVLVISLIVFAGSILSNLFGVGALLP